MVDTTTMVLIGNMVVNCILAILYSYRVKIEKKQIDITGRNAEAKTQLETLKRYIAKEKNDIKNMSREELADFLDYLERLGEE
jgi:DNA relaxase NicK